jgi:putative sigma-54 modulation protein
MNIEILGHSVKVNESVREHAQKKVERLTHYLPNISDVRVEFSHDHTRRGDDINTVQITVRHQRGAILRAQESIQGDVETAFNEALDRLHRQIERFKGKRTRKGRASLRASLDEIESAQPAPIADSDETDAEEPVISIVRRKAVPIVAMNDEEAIEQMELLGHDFFIYFDENVSAISVAYKRRAGGYGILTPKLS